jgi:hypothetical protein
MRGRFAATAEAVDEMDPRFRGLSGFGVVGGGEDIFFFGEVLMSFVWM